MLRTTLSLLLLFLLLSLGVAQVAQTKNVETRCGKFETLRKGQPGGDSLTDIDTKRVLEVVESLDLNNDTFITPDERLTAIENSFQNSTRFNLTAGIARCAMVDFLASDRSLDKYVGAYFYDYFDTNGDLLIKLEDYDEPSDVIIKRVDTDNDGNLTVCEFFSELMRGLQKAENQVYEHEIKYRAIADKSKRTASSAETTTPSNAGEACASHSIIVIVGVYLFQLLRAVF